MQGLCTSRQPCWMYAALPSLCVDAAQIRGFNSLCGGHGPGGFCASILEASMHLVQLNWTALVNSSVSCICFNFFSLSIFLQSYRTILNMHTNNWAFFDLNVFHLLPTIWQRQISRLNWTTTDIWLWQCVSESLTSTPIHINRRKIDTNCANNCLQYGKKSSIVHLILLFADFCGLKRIFREDKELECFDAEFYLWPSKRKKN